MKSSLQRYRKMFKYLSLNVWIFCLLNNSLWPKISHLKVKGKSDGYFDQPASVNSWTMSGVSTCIWGTDTHYLAFLEFEHLFPFALFPNQSTINMTVFSLLSIQTVTMDVIQKIFIVVFLVTTNLYWIYCKYIVQKKNKHKPNEIFDRSSQWRNEHNHCCMLQIGTKIYCNKNLRNKNLLIFKNQH